MASTLMDISIKLTVVARTVARRLLVFHRGKVSGGKDCI